jgi:tetratricopeptide (TPR) repeat protein
VPESVYPANVRPLAFDASLDESNEAEATVRGMLGDLGRLTKTDEATPLEQELCLDVLKNWLYIRGIVPKGYRDSFFRALDRVKAWSVEWASGHIDAYRYDVLARACEKLYDVDGAVSHRESILAIVEKLYGVSSVSAAAAREALGDALVAREDYAAALEAYERAFACKALALGDGDEGLVETYRRLATALSGTGEYVSALERLASARDVIEGLPSSGGSALAEIDVEVAVVLARMGESDLSIDRLEEACDALTGIFGESDPRVGAVHRLRGDVHFAIGDYERALNEYMSALVVFESAFGDNDVDTAVALCDVANVFALQGNPAAGLWYLRALNVLEGKLGEMHPATGNAYNNFAALYALQGEYAKALILYLRSASIKEKTMGVDSPSTRAAYERIADLYEIRGDATKASKWRTRAAGGNA